MCLCVSLCVCVSVCASMSAFVCVCVSICFCVLVCVCDRKLAVGQEIGENQTERLSEERKVSKALLNLSDKWRECEGPGQVQLPGNRRSGGWSVMIILAPSTHLAAESEAATANRA